MQVSFLFSFPYSIPSIETLTLPLRSTSPSCQWPLSDSVMWCQTRFRLEDSSFRSFIICLWTHFSISRSLLSHSCSVWYWSQLSIPQCILSCTKHSTRYLCQIYKLWIYGYLRVWWPWRKLLMRFMLMHTRRVGTNCSRSAFFVVGVPTDNCHFPEAPSCIHHAFPLVPFHGIRYYQEQRNSSHYFHSSKLWTIE